MNGTFDNWELSPRLQAKYAAPICEASRYDNCAPWMKQGKRIGFQYVDDNQRLNECNTLQARTNDVTKECCQNRGAYTTYRGRCIGYDEYFRTYNPVNGI